MPAEICNGSDDDCDGATDEHVLNACGAVPVEACNGSDDDCDGATDEHVLNACGGCGAVPTETCNGSDDDCDGATDEHVRNACGGCGAVPAEICNGDDDDCDGSSDEGLVPSMTSDDYESNDTWSTARSFSTGPSLAPRFGAGAAISPALATRLPGCDGGDHFLWYRSYASYDPTYTQRWMCRVVGLQPGQSVDLRVGVFVPGGLGTFNQHGCSGSNLSCFHYGQNCTNRGNDGTCYVSIAQPTQGSSPYAFGAAVVPRTGWSGCDIDYDVECRLNTRTTW